MQVDTRNTCTDPILPALTCICSWYFPEKQTKLPPHVQYAPTVEMADNNVFMHDWEAPASWGPWPWGKVCLGRQPIWGLWYMGGQGTADIGQCLVPHLELYHRSRLSFLFCRPLDSVMKWIKFYSLELETEPFHAVVNLPVVLTCQSYIDDRQACL